MTIGFFLRKNCSDKGLNLFLHSFKNIWPFDVIYRGVLINLITPSMRFLVMVWWIFSVNYCFNLFLSSFNDIWCFYIFFLKKRKKKKERMKLKFSLPILHTWNSISIRFSFCSLNKYKLKSIFYPMNSMKLWASIYRPWLVSSAIVSFYWIPFILLFPPPFSST